MADRSPQPSRGRPRASFWRRNRIFVILFAFAASAAVYGAFVLVNAGGSRPTAGDPGGPSASGGNVSSAAPSGSVTPTVSPSATPKPSASPKPATAACSTTKNVAGGRDPNGGCFPGPANTGVPAGVKLTSYSGPCTITKAKTVISGKHIRCDLLIRAAGVVIEKSKIDGTISNTSQSYSFTLRDSTLNATPDEVLQVTGVGDVNFTVLRSEVIGGNRGIYCAVNCTIQDSWIHGQRIKDSWHASAVRMEQRTRVIHNSMTCDAERTSTDGSCSATLTGYPDFAPIRDNLIQGNLFLVTRYSAFCAYGGSTKGKPFSGQSGGIVFKDNIFQRGTHSWDCALYGPISDFDEDLPGNVWSNNKFDDGEVIDT
jgi:hypothetical protein